ncbi:Hypothetical predicted protein [Prunus dulcis]|uniref:Dynamin stalk domain-containing protein n=1 Tax=Prunus dulcis TaxID=3755 RepID=A0A5E4EW98_PRUDU|nr:Hypothetical predicted protein [Prunus dulcis]
MCSRRRCLHFLYADDDDFSIAKRDAASSSSLRLPLKKLFFEERDTPNSVKSFYNSEGGLNSKEIFLRALISDASNLLLPWWMGKVRRCQLKNCQEEPIFVKCLEEVDPCDDLTDDDIRMAIQNASGARNALFVLEVPFEFLVRRQNARLLDPSLQCLRFVYDELMKRYFLLPLRLYLVKL